MQTVDEAYNGWERCFKMDICVGCPYNCINSLTNELIFPRPCMSALIKDLNTYIKEGDLVTDVILENPYIVTLRKVGVRSYGGSQEREKDI